MPTPLSAQLLARLAEAADGHRTGEPVWLVAATDPPYDVDSFTTEVDARQAGESSGREVFGPCVTPRDLQDDVVEPISVTIRHADGSEETVDLQANLDALFFTQAAVDKFVRPYYARFPEFRVQLESVGPLSGHDRSTRWLPAAALDDNR